MWQPRGVQIRRLTAVAAAGIALVGLAGCRTSPNVAAYVGDEQVTVSELEAAIEERRADPAIAEFADTGAETFTRRVLTGLVEDEVHATAAERYGVEVTGDDVRDRIDELLGDDDPTAVFAELAAQGVSRQDVFSSVEQQLVRLRIAEAEDLAAGLEEDALRARYDEIAPQQAEYSLGYITVPDQGAADEAVAALEDDPAAYAELAEQFPGETTLPEPQTVPTQEVPPPFAEQVAEAEPGSAFAIPVEGVDGVVVVFVADVTLPTFEELRPQLEQEAAGQAEEAVQQLLDEVREDLGIVINPRYGTFDEGAIREGGSDVVEILGAEG